MGLDFYAGCILYSGKTYENSEGQAYSNWYIKKGFIEALVVQSYWELLSKTAEGLFSPWNPNDLQNKKGSGKQCDPFTS